MIPVIRPVILRKKYVILVIRINFKEKNSFVRFVELIKDHKDHVFLTQDHGPDHRDHAQLIGLQYGRAQHRRHRRRPTHCLRLFTGQITCGPALTAASEDDP